MAGQNIYPWNRKKEMYCINISICHFLESSGGEKHGGVGGGDVAAGVGVQVPPQQLELKDLGMDV